MGKGWMGGWERGGCSGWELFRGGGKERVDGWLGAWSGVIEIWRFRRPFQQLWRFLRYLNGFLLRKDIPSSSTHPLSHLPTPTRSLKQNFLAARGVFRAPSRRFRIEGEYDGLEP